MAPAQCRDRTGGAPSPGDQAGCVRHADGSVTTPPGFKEAYQAYVDAGWGAGPLDGFDPEAVAAG